MMLIGMGTAILSGPGVPLYYLDQPFGPLFLAFHFVDRLDNQILFVFQLG
jgi:hypothetical protein